MTGTSSASCSISPSLVAQRVDGIESRGAPRRIERGEEGQGERHDHDRDRLAEIDLGWQLGEKIERGIEQFRVGEPGQKLPDGFDVEADQEPDQKADEGPD